MSDDLGRQAVDEAYEATKQWYVLANERTPYAKRDEQMLELALAILILAAEAAQRLIRERQSP